MPTGQRPSLYLCRPLLQFVSENAQSENAPPELLKDILQMSVEESLHLPAMFMLVVHNTYVPARLQDKPWRHEKYFEIGKKLKLGFAASTTEASMFSEDTKAYLIEEGEITAIEVHFTNKSEAHIVIRGYDVSHRLQRGRYNRSFLNMTDSDIVRKIAAEMGIKPGQIDNSGAPHDYVFQENQTNMEFLRERAARIGFELFVQDNKLNFRKPASNAPPLTLQWLRDIFSFSTRVTSAQQVSEVEVRGWNYKNKNPGKMPIIARAKSEKLITKTGNGQGSSTSTVFNRNKKPKMIVVDQPVFQQQEADRMAQALCDELGGEFVYADAKAEGNPDIRVGRVINLQGMGDRYSGKYYVTETRHFYSQRVYTTEFSVRGLRGGSLFTTITPQVHLQPGQTLLVGIVDDNRDPENLGRVKVRFPTLEDQVSNWARVVGLGAGNNRGFYCLPEVNDEVIVGFEHGDIHRPYVIGGVWNGAHRPPRDVNETIQGQGEKVPKKVRLRTIKTRTGHTIEFVEEDGRGTKAGVYITTAGGHILHLNDSQGFVEIKTNRGHQIKMADRGTPPGTPPTISISSIGNLSLSARGKLSLDASVVSLNANKGPMTLNATGMLSLTSIAPAVLIKAPVIGLAAPSILCGGLPVPPPVSTAPLGALITQSQIGSMVP